MRRLIALFAFVATLSAFENVALRPDCNGAPPRWFNTAWRTLRNWQASFTRRFERQVRGFFPIGSQMN